jgi:pimeloyl-ACP methyl ester carboxylesterase
MNKLVCFQFSSPFLVQLKKAYFCFKFKMMKQIGYKNTEISYSEVGKGRVIVLLHGFLENKTMWQELAPELSKKHRVITIDLLGHGESGCLGYVHSMEENAEVVHAVLSKLRIHKANFVGHSMGGYVALAFAEMYPANIKALVLLNSTARADSEERKTNRDRAIKAVKKDYAGFVRLSIANLFSPDNRERLVDEIEKVKTEALKTPLQGVLASLEGMKIRKDRENLLRFATYHNLLILGKKDPVLNYEDNLKQIENTAVKLVAFPDGHMSHIENKEELKTVLLDFFKGI